MNNAWRTINLVTHNFMSIILSPKHFQLLHKTLKKTWTNSDQLSFFSAISKPRLEISKRNCPRFISGFSLINDPRCSRVSQLTAEFWTTAQMSWTPDALFCYLSSHFLLFQEPFGEQFRPLERFIFVIAGIGRVDCQKRGRVRDNVTRWWRRSHCQKATGTVLRIKIVVAKGSLML